MRGVEQSYRTANSEAQFHQACQRRNGGYMIEGALLVAVGVGPTDHRSTLGCSVSFFEAEVHWREFMPSRGLTSVRLIALDDRSCRVESHEKVGFPLLTLAAMPASPPVITS